MLNQPAFIGWETKTLFQGSKNFFRDFSEGHTQGFFKWELHFGHFVSFASRQGGKRERQRCKMGDVMFTGGEEGECRLAQVKGVLQEKEKLYP